MKHFVMILFCFFVSLSVNGLAQKYYTLPEIKEQVKEGWHETCADKYGREIQVNVDVDVFGEQMAPLIKAGFPQHDIYSFQCEKNRRKKDTYLSFLRKQRGFG